MGSPRTAALSEARKFARSIIEDPEYKRILIARANAGHLAPQVEVMLYHYAYGKPIEVIESRTTIEDLRNKKVDELISELDETRTKLLAAVEAREHAREMLKQINEARDKEAAQTETTAQNVVHFADHIRPNNGNQRPH